MSGKIYNMTSESVDSKLPPLPADAKDSNDLYSYGDERYFEADGFVFKQMEILTGNINTYVNSVIFGPVLLKILS